MKTILTILLLLIFFLPLKNRAQTSIDTEQIEKIGYGASLYFYRQQLDSFANLFDKNATFITVTGLKATGIKDIVDLHHMGKYLIESSTKPILRKPLIGFRNENIAVVYCVWDGLVFMEGDKKGPIQSGYLTLLLQKKNQQWKIISATNAYNFLGMPNFDFEIYNHEKVWKEFGLEGKKVKLAD